ncbi:MAG: hypothetical protein DRP85_03265 [Candidatus Makaraimicrobium thalassicum]|nr:MAG: hypothetical protein DRP85_03265 [Candidatus Omnitrophota bacterium]
MGLFDMYQGVNQQSPFGEQPQRMGLADMPQQAPIQSNYPMTAQERAIMEKEEELERLRQTFESDERDKKRAMAMKYTPGIGSGTGSGQGKDMSQFANVGSLMNMLNGMKSRDGQQQQPYQDFMPPIRGLMG